MRIWRYVLLIGAAAVLLGAVVVFGAHESSAVPRVSRDAAIGRVLELAPESTVKQARLDSDMAGQMWEVQTDTGLYWIDADDGSFRGATGDLGGCAAVEGSKLTLAAAREVARQVAERYCSLDGYGLEYEDENSDVGMTFEWRLRDADGVLIGWTHVGIDSKTGRVGSVIHNESTAPDHAAVRISAEDAIRLVEDWFGDTDGLVISQDPELRMLRSPAGIERAVWQVTWEWTTADYVEHSWVLVDAETGEVYDGDKTWTLP